MLPAFPFYESCHVTFVYDWMLYDENTLSNYAELSVCLNLTWFPFVVMWWMLLILKTWASQKVSFMIFSANPHLTASLFWCSATRLTNQELCQNRLWPKKCKSFHLIHLINRTKQNLSELLSLKLFHNMECSLQGTQVNYGPRSLLLHDIMQELDQHRLSYRLACKAFQIKELKKA